MTSDVKGWGLPFLALHAMFVLRAAAEAEPGSNDGCSCCSPWGEDHLPCVRRVPASLSARVCPQGLCTLSRVPPHRGGVSAAGQWKPSEVRVAVGAVFWPYGVPGTAGAIAPRHPPTSRAMATTTWLACCPRAISL
jgi:hypothetical protein